MEEVKEIIEEQQEEIGDDLQRTNRGRISYTTQGNVAVFTNPFGDSHMARTRITFPRSLVARLKDPLLGKHIKHNLPKGPGYQKAAKEHRLKSLTEAYENLIDEVMSGFHDDLRCVVLANQMLDNWCLSGWHPSLMMKIFDLDSFKFGVLVQPPLDKRALASRLKRDFQATMFDHLQVAMVWTFFLEFKGTGPRGAIHSNVSCLMNDIMMLDYVSHTHDEQVEDFILSAEGVQPIESINTRITEFLCDGNDNPEAYFSSITCDVPYPKPWRKALILRILYFWDSFNEENPITHSYTENESYARNEILKMKIAAHYRRRLWQRLRCGSFAGKFSPLEESQNVVKGFEELTDSLGGAMISNLQKIASLMQRSWFETDARKEPEADHLTMRLRFCPDLIGNRFVFESMVKEGRISIAAPQNQALWLAEDEFNGGSKAQRRAFAAERSTREKEIKVVALIRASAKAAVEGKEKEMVEGLSVEEKKTVEMWDINMEDQKSIISETKENKEMNDIIMGYLRSKGVKEIGKEQFEKIAAKEKVVVLRPLVKAKMAEQEQEDKEEDEVDLDWQIYKHKVTESWKNVKEKEGEDYYGYFGKKPPPGWGERDSAILKALIKKTLADESWNPDVGSNYERIRDKYMRQIEEQKGEIHGILEGFVRKRKAKMLQKTDSNGDSDLEEEARGGGEERYKEHFKEATGTICAIREDCDETDSDSGGKFEYLEERRLQMEAFVEERNLERRIAIDQFVVEQEADITYEDLSQDVPTIPFDFGDPEEVVAPKRKRGRPPLTRATAYKDTLAHSAHLTRVMEEREGEEYTGPKYGKKK
jgi:hypothetical protein